MLGSRKAASRRAVAAVEFVLVAPFALVLTFGVFDLARACIVWQQTCSAAQAVAEAAEKLSYTVGSSQTQLTGKKMQQAMSTAYAEIVGLSLGNGTSSSGSSFTVTLSGVVFSPTCTTSSGCNAQVPYVSWSTGLVQTGLVATPALRACGALAAVAAFPDDSTQLTKMVSWSQNQIALAPQVVADVRTIYVPLFSMFTGPVTFWSSAAVPAPIGGTDQAIAYSSADPSGTVQTCTVPSS